MMNQINMRRSVRKYVDKPIEEEKITELMESARLAPSGHNTQPWHFIIVKSQGTKEKLAELSHNQKWMLAAPQARPRKKLDEIVHYENWEGK